MPDSHDLPVGRETLPGRSRAGPHSLEGEKPRDELQSLLRGRSDDDDALRLGVKTSVAVQEGGRNSRLPPLPQRRQNPRWPLLLSFLLFVGLPTALVGFYYYAVAADQYVAEFKFAVTESSPILPGIPPAATATSPAAAGAGMGAALLGSAAAMMGGTNASMQNYVVSEYLVSRQAVEELQKRIDLRGMYDRSDLKYDFVSRFGRDLPIERFVRYWNHMVSATYDPATGIATVTVRAFSPQEAQLIADTMVSLSEDLVNGIARRPQVDAVRFSEGELKRAEERLKRARDALTEYRLQEGVIDPTGPMSTNVALVQTLRSQLTQQRGDLAALLSQQQNPNAPAVQSLRSRIAATKDQLDKIEKEVSKDREGNRILAALVDRYERIDLERQYAQSMLIAAQHAYDQARANAAAQHLYLTPFVRPGLPEYATHPKKIKAVLLATLGFFSLWLVGTMFVRTVAEHT